jgi:hypothetical protein
MPTLLMSLRDAPPLATAAIDNISIINPVRSFHRDLPLPLSHLSCQQLPCGVRFWRKDAHLTASTQTGRQAGNTRQAEYTGCLYLLTSQPFVFAHGSRQTGRQAGRDETTRMLAHQLRIYGVIRHTATH